MMKPLSTQLADLSARAKKAEDAVAAAQKEAHDKLLARREQHMPMPPPRSKRSTGTSKVPAIQSSQTGIRLRRKPPPS